MRKVHNQFLFRENKSLREQEGRETQVFEVIIQL